MGSDKQTECVTAKPGIASPEEIARFLRRNPDFLLNRPDLCATILPGLDCGEGVVDLRTALLERARVANEALRQEIARLADTARNLQAEQRRVLAAARALLSADSFEGLVGKVGQDLPSLLQLDAVALAIEQRDEALCETRRPPCMRGLVQLAPGMVERILGSESDIKVASCPHGMPEVFGAGAGLIRAEALIRLTVSDKTPPALLGLGSRDEARFALGRATDGGGRALLLFLAATFGELLRTWLALPR
ncbi:MAG: DUF484 family protein [Rhodospirillales bacterium]|nr:DUF484 family protein [Rhodospirillales bacterium]